MLLPKKRIGNAIQTPFGWTSATSLCSAWSRSLFELILVLPLLERSAIFPILPGMRSQTRTDEVAVSDITQTSLSGYLL